jgi:hypothetical protein
MEKRNRITYFSNGGKFKGMIRSRNEEWKSYGVSLTQNKIKKKLVDMK